MTCFRIFFCAWAALLACLPAWGQHIPTEKQFLAQWRQTKSDTGRVLLMCEYAWLLRGNSPTKAFQYAQRAHKHAEQIRFFKGRIKSLSYMGVAMRNLGNYAIANDYLSEALTLAQQADSREEEGFGNVNIGNVLYLEGKYAEARQYLDRALAMSYAIKNEKMKAYALLNLGRVYNKQHQKKEASKALQDAINIRQKLHDTLGIAVVKYELAEAFAEQQQFRQAKQHLDSLARLTIAMNDLDMYAGVENLLAKVAISENLLAEAERHAALGLNVAMQVRDKSRIASLYKTFADLSMKKGDYRQAFTYQSQFIVYQDSLHLETIKTHNSQWEFSHKLQEQEKEIQQEHLQIQNQNFWLSVTIFALMLVLVVAVFIYLRYKQQQLQHKEISAINADLKRSNDLAEGYNSELIKLNEELHDKNKALRKGEDEQKRLNQILMEKNLQLQEMNHEKDSLMGIVAHDLKAPLNRIRGVLELLHLSGELNPDQKQLVEMGHGIINNGSNLIRDLLDITYYEQGATKMRWAVFDWNIFLQEHIDTFAQEAQKKGIALRLALPALPTENLSDEDCLSRVVSNLLSNAIKFSPHDRAIYVSLSVQTNTLQVSIRDEGQGFTEEDKRKIFNKFEKLSARPTAGESSTGLGLSIIKVLTEKLKGSITLESEAGKGANFILTFPLQKQP